MLNSTECISLFVKIGVNDPQAIISIQFVKLIVLQAADMNGGKRSLRRVKHIPHAIRRGQFSVRKRCEAVRCFQSSSPPLPAISSSDDDGTNGSDW